MGWRGEGIGGKGRLKFQVSKLVNVPFRDHEVPFDT